MLFNTVFMISEKALKTVFNIRPCDGYESTDFPQKNKSQKTHPP